MALTRITKGVIKPNENYDTHNINSTGIVTAIGLDINGNGDISGNLSVGGVLTYEDVTSIDSVGIITAQKDIHVGAGVSAVGVGTFGSLDIGGDIDVDGHTNLDNVSIAGLSTHSGGIFIPNNEKLEFSGSVGSSKIRLWQHPSLGSLLEFTSQSNGYIGHNASGASKNITFNSGNDFIFKGLQSNGAIIDIARFYKTGQRCALNADGVEKFTTSSKGIQVGTGVTIETSGQAEIAGITTFYKDVHIKSGTNRLYLGSNDRLSLIADPSHSYLRNAGSGSHFQIHSDNFSIRSHQGNGSITLFYSPISDGNEGGGPRLYHNHGAGIILERLRTTKSGVNITGVTTTTGLAVTGVSTFTGAIDANGDLNVAENIIHTDDTDTKIRFTNNKIQIQAGGTTRIQTTSIGAQIDTTLLLYGPAGNPGRLRLQEGGALSEIRVARNSDNNSFLFFDTEISGTTSTRVVIDESGHFRPWTDSDYDLGINGTRWRNVYADTYYGDGSNLTGIVADKIFEGNTEVETVDTGSDGHVKITTEGVESFRIDKRGYSLLGRDYSTNPSNGLVGITTIRGHRVNSAGDYARLYFKNSTVSGSSSASIRAYRDNGNYNTGFSFYTNYSTSSGGDGQERFLINSLGTVVKQTFASNQTYAANDTTQLGYQSQNVSDVTNTYTALRLTAGNSSPATAQLSSIRTGAGQNDFTIQLESGNTAFETFRALSNGNFGFGIAAPTTQSGRVVHLHAGANQQRLHMTNNTTGSTATDGFEIIVNEGTETHVRNFEAGNFRISTGGNGAQYEAIRIKSNGSVNIGGDFDQTTYKLKVTGSFAATTKSFVIDHPTKEKHKLRYACLEGPENSVYVRGKTSDSVIELPDYWTGLVHEDSITVNVTPIGNHKVWVESINNNSVTIGSDGSEYFYTVFAERKDVDKLEVEVEE